jgi:hypothetical protein
MTKLMGLIALIVVLYCTITYGAWYWATRWQWEDRKGKNGTLFVDYVGPKSIEASVIAPNKTHTEIRNGFPILLTVGRATFTIQKQHASGFARLSLRFNEILLWQTYTDGGANSEPIHFSRGPERERSTSK